MNTRRPTRAVRARARASILPNILDTLNLSDSQSRRINSTRDVSSYHQSDSNSTPASTTSTTTISNTISSREIAGLRIVTPITSLDNNDVIRNDMDIAGPITRSARAAAAAAAAAAVSNNQPSRQIFPNSTRPVNVGRNANPPRETDPFVSSSTNSSIPQANIQGPFRYQRPVYTRRDISTPLLTTTSDSEKDDSEINDSLVGDHQTCRRNVSNQQSHRDLPSQEPARNVTGFRVVRDKDGKEEMQYISMSRPPFPQVESKPQLNKPNLSRTEVVGDSHVSLERATTEKFKYGEESRLRIQDIPTVYPIDQEQIHEFSSHDVESGDESDVNQDDETNSRLEMKLSRFIDSYWRDGKTLYSNYNDGDDGDWMLRKQTDVVMRRLNHIVEKKLESERWRFEGDDGFDYRHF